MLLVVEHAQGLSKVVVSYQNLPGTRAESLPFISSMLGRCGLHCNRGDADLEDISKLQKACFEMTI